MLKPHPRRSDSRRRALVVAFVLASSWLVPGAPAGALAQSIRTTRHNLSVTGPGPIRATTEERICIFCHAPHRASGSPPLWNHEDTRSTYVVYDSPTLDAVPGQPDGASRLCLSCHDGTIALGSVISEASAIAMQGGVTTLPPGHSNLDVDLSNDHPVSFPYDDALAAADPQIVPPASLPPDLPLDHNGRMQCSSCHDAHRDDFGDFLRRSPLFSQLCTGCHQKTGWSGSIHDQSTATWNGAGADPWPHAPGNTVAENGCMNCHETHEAGQPFNLLDYLQEEDNCLKCHDGNTAGDVASAFSLASVHPVSAQSGVHVPGEDPTTMPRHVECTDCHNPHAANTDDPPPPAADGALRMVSGIDIDGAVVSSVTYGYEVCLKCHGDNHGSTPVVTRQITNLNVRQEFHPTSASFHPVAAPGRNPDVPSLIAPLSESSIIECTDCHASPQGYPAGAHGSTYAPLLVRNYETADYTKESASAYALCYGCHDRNSILTNQSFKEHKKHIQGEDAPCVTCHDPHGISAGTGNTTNNAHLINFDVTIVQPNSKGLLKFEDLGTRRGQCYLRCHGKDHNPKTY